MQVMYMYMLCKKSICGYVEYQNNKDFMRILQFKNILTSEKSHLKQDLLNHLFYRRR